MNSSTSTASIPELAEQLELVFGRQDQLRRALRREHLGRQRIERQREGAAAEPLAPQSIAVCRIA